MDPSTSTSTSTSGAEWTFTIDDTGLTLYRGGHVYSTYRGREPGGARPSAVQMARFVFDLGAGLLEQPGLSLQEAQAFLGMASEFTRAVRGY